MKISERTDLWGGVDKAGETDSGLLEAGGGRLRWIKRHGCFVSGGTQERTKVEGHTDLRSPLEPASLRSDRVTS